ncbi:hypothetical protein GNQ08_18320 [Paenibacillus macerans]|uniref:Uncharacterized protein n=1 Tax=Paenibacillus macerans TaxID=44252 RepID=A0A6N8F112_PAEMA|nr:hypothetical protein [Paenibacillus macerans]MUG24338.1 hypothetical protein [Paenibacillus macerans]UMV50347.1 hypothetical protein LMZ02_13775 [Paenibacillus macerans]
MLSDLERKLLRILYSYSTQRKRMPTIGELEIKTGRNKQDIFAGLRGLVEQRYIFWPDNPRLDTLVILEAWERDQPQRPKFSASSGNIDYWTKY